MCSTWSGHGDKWPPKKQTISTLYVKYDFDSLLTAYESLKIQIDRSFAFVIIRDVRQAGGGSVARRVHFFHRHFDSCFGVRMSRWPVMTSRKEHTTSLSSRGPDIRRFAVDKLCWHSSLTDATIFATHCTAFLSLHITLQAAWHK